ncbi:hypothetical protein Agub_g11390, partial [Astrephomene gubernaculifera]
KTYTFLLGKPNPAKLGNFPEVDLFVQVADPQGLLLDCRDYLAPLATPWEAGLAWAGRYLDWEDYRLGLGEVLELEQILQQRNPEEGQEEEDGEEDSDGDGLGSRFGGLTLATRGSGTALAGGPGSSREVAVRSAA